MLIQKNCRSQVDLLNDQQIEQLLDQVPNWQHDKQQNRLTRCYPFKHYLQSIDFVNEIANLAEQQDHHPQMMIGYRQCQLSFTTHSAKGITMNDFICAQKSEQIFNELTGHGQ